MSRIIKFRFFDTTCSSMYSMDRIQDYSLEQLHRFSSTNDPYTKVMQFTGLKDKNGIEIYEGDIFFNGFDNSKIMYDQPTSSFVAFDGCEGFNMGAWISEINIIGNIHETPDLFEAKPPQ